MHRCMSSNCILVHAANLRVADKADKLQDLNCVQTTEHTNTIRTSDRL